MENNNDFSLISLPLADNTFQLFSEFIYKKSGIVLNQNKQNLLANRLRKRLRELKLKSFEEYWQLLQDPKQQKEELTEFLNVVTTNETYFQRGINHYEILEKYILPYYLKNHKKKIRLWSAGCSSGEEPYDIALTMFEFNRKHLTQLDFQIMASDISQDVLTMARFGEYADRKIAKLPESLRKYYFEKVSEEDFQQPFAHDVLRVKPFVKEKVSFLEHNLQSSNYYQGVDIIFCRNVMIYFDQKTQESIIQKFTNSLNSDGFLFIGHSETLRIFESKLHTLRFEEGTIYATIPLSQVLANKN